MAGLVARLFTTMREAGDPVQVASFEVGILLNGTLIVHVLLYFMSYEQGAWPHIEEEGGGVAATSSNTSVLILSCLRDRVAGKQNKFLL